MIDLLVQVAGLCALVGGVALGYWRWIKARDAALDLAGRGLLLLIIVTLTGGLIGGVGWWIDDPRSFSWDLPPVASRMLASAAWAFVVVTVMALQRPVFRRLRLTLVMLVAYLLPLLVAIVLFHRDRFDLAAPITYAFFAIVLVLTLLALWYLLYQPQIIPDQPHDLAPSSTITHGWLIFVGLSSALWGLALFATDDGPSSLIWAWRGDLLTNRLIVVMLLTIAVGAAYSRRYADLSLIMLGVTTVYGGGVGVAHLWNVLAARPINVAYVGAFGGIFAVSALLLVIEDRKLRNPTTSAESNERLSGSTGARSSR